MFNYVPEMRWRLIVTRKKLTGGLVGLTGRRKEAVLVVWRLGSSRKCSSALMQLRSKQNVLNVLSAD
jgi:hypothetical protein